MPIDRTLIAKKLDFLSELLTKVERMEFWDIPRKETAKDAFLLLGQERIIDKELAGKMGKAADFRNRVVHGYNDFDWRILFNDYRDDLADLRNFGAQIVSFLDRIKLN